MVSVSVIIPAYNVAPYLEECLDSVLAQTLQEVEIILVDDGSTDETPEIIARYAVQHAGIKTIRQKNKGLGAARNAGLALAKGKAVAFLDSDDYYTPGTLQAAFDALQAGQCDIVLFNGKAFDDDGKSRHWRDGLYFELREEDSGRVYTGADLVVKTGGRIQSACLKLYRRAYLAGQGLTFPEGCFGEDVPFFYQCMLPAKRVEYVHVAGYCRRYRPKSIMTTVNKDHLASRIHIFKTLPASLLLVKDVAQRKKVQKQMLYYACVLWASAMASADRTQLVALCRDEGLTGYVRQNKINLVVWVFAVIMGLPKGLSFIQKTYAAVFRAVFKKKVRLWSS